MEVDGSSRPAQLITYVHIPAPYPPNTQKTTQLTVTQVLDFVLENGFNALRVPFSLAMALDLGKVNEQWLVDEGAYRERGVRVCGDRLGEKSPVRCRCWSKCKVDYITRHERRIYQSKYPHNAHLKITTNPDLRNLPCGELLSKFVDKCAARGLLVVSPLLYLAGVGLGWVGLDTVHMHRSIDVDPTI